MAANARLRLRLGCASTSAAMLFVLACAAREQEPREFGTVLPPATPAATPQPAMPATTDPSAPPPAAAEPTPAPAPEMADAAVEPAPALQPAAAPAASGLPAGAEQVAGIEFLQRVAGKWSGINSNTPFGFDFPMTVDIAPSGDNLLFGEFEIDADNNVLWGFNIENYGGHDVLAYRNGGYLGGLLRDSRTQLVEHDTIAGYYRFCAVKELGLPVDGCNYIDARYTFLAPDHMLFVVTTQSGKPHVNWDATRIETRPLPSPFPTTSASQGDGSAPWPAAAGIH